MISKKTAPPQAATPTAKPATRRIAAKKPVTKAALPATRRLPAAKKVAVKKTPSAKPAGSTRVATQAAQVSAITLTEVSEIARKPPDSSSHTAKLGPPAPRKRATLLAAMLASEPIVRLAVSAG